jgi:hypothetical protein
MCVKQHGGKIMEFDRTPFFPNDVGFVFLGRTTLNTYYQLCTKENKIGVMCFLTTIKEKL